MEQIVEKAHEAGRCCMAFHPSKEYLYIGSSEGLIKSYSYGLSNKSLSLSSILDDASQCHDDPIHEICFSASGDYFSICCDDGECVLFRHPSCSLQSIIWKNDCSVSSISFEKSAQYSFLFAMADDSGNIKIVNVLKLNTDHFKFKCKDIEGIRNIKFIPFKPDPFRASREKYLMIAQCNGNISIWKIFNQNIFDQNKEDNEKFIKINEFQHVFPKIKGGDINQRLIFDSTQNGDLIAIPGNNNIKILNTKLMKFMDAINMNHNFAVNCCSFNKDLEKLDDNNYILATGDIRGNISIWNIKYDENIFESLIIDQIAGNVAICNLIWKNGNELIVSSINGNIYKYDFEHDDIKNNKENIDESNKMMTDIDNKDNDNDISMEIDHDDNDKNDNNENKEEEKSRDKKKFESDSDEDFDIDMNVNDDNDPTPTKKILRRSFEDDSDTSPSPPSQIINTNKKTTETTAAITANNNDETKTAVTNTLENKVNKTMNDEQLKADFAAAAELFGDDDDINANKDDFINKPKDTTNNKMKIESFFETEAEDSNINKTKEKEEENMAMNDDGEDLKDFIVDESEQIEETQKTNTKKRKKEKNIIDDDMGMDDMDDMNEEFDDKRGGNDIIYSSQSISHESFINGNTMYNEDGSRYLLFNEIGGVVVRKQNMSLLEMNNIINSLNNTKYSIEIDFFDKSKYSRAVTIKSNHHFVCCDVNCNAILLGSHPDGDDIKESIIRYKPISRNNEYRSFSSEKDCEWTHILQSGEICISVGLTNKYALIATNKRFLRILSMGGLQTNQIISLPKNVINICGMRGNSKSNIVAITFDDLSLWILDLDENKKIYDGHCCVTASDSRITRIYLVGNGDNYKLITIDSDDYVRLLSDNTFGSNWIVIMDINDYLNKKYPLNDENNMRPKGIWPVYFDLDEQCLMVTELKYLDYPIASQSNGSYILTEYPLCIPLLNMNNNEIDPITNERIILFGDREEKLIRKSVVSEFANNCNKKQLLKDYLMLFGDSCKSNKTVLAYDIAIHFLDTEKALSAAIKVAMHHQLPLLAEQITNLAKQKIHKIQKIQKIQTQTTINNNNTRMNKPNNNLIKKPVRSLGKLNKLKRPTAKLGGNKKTVQNNGINEVTSTMQRTKLIGKKRPNNPCQDNESMEPPKKRNPFSCNNANKNGQTNNNKYNDRKNNNSIFSV